MKYQQICHLQKKKDLKSQKNNPGGYYEKIYKTICIVAFGNVLY